MAASSSAAATSRNSGPAPGGAGGRLRNSSVERPVSPRADELADGQLIHDDPRRERPVTRVGGMADGLGQAAMAPVPVGGAPVQVRDLARVLAAELEAQDRAEQRVVAVRAVPDGADERVRPGEFRERARGVAAAPVHQVVGDIRADPGQDAGAQEEFADRRGLGVEDLFHQVAGDGAVLSRELLDELRRVGMPFQRDRGQAQARRPALGPPGQRLHGRIRQGDAVLGEQQRGLAHAEGQVAGPDLAEFAAYPVAVQGEERVHP